MTDGYLCDRCETFHEDKRLKSTFTTTVEATGRKKDGSMGEESTWDLCPHCATHLVNVVAGPSKAEQEADA